MGWLSKPPPMSSGKRVHGKDRARSAKWLNDKKEAQRKAANAAARKGW